MIARLVAASAGLLTFVSINEPYMSGGTAMVITIAVMIALDVVHPPAVSTALSFAFRAEDASNLLLFGLALGVTAVLVLLERWTLWALASLARRRGGPS